MVRARSQPVAGEHLSCDMLFHGKVGNKLKSFQMLASKPAKKESSSLNRSACPAVGITCEPSKL